MPRSRSKPAPPAPKPETAPAPAPAPAEAITLEGRKVLIVDDDRQNLALVKEGLAPHGYQFAEAYDGTQALSALRVDRPDLILRRGHHDDISRPEFLKELPFGDPPEKANRLVDPKLACQRF